MVSESSDVQNFLSNHPLFAHLSSNLIDFVCANISIAFSKSGEQIQINNNGKSSGKTGLVIVRSGSLEIREANGALIDRLSSGDFIFPKILRPSEKHLRQLQVLEDCLYYELTEFAFQSLAADSKLLQALSDTYSRTYLFDGNQAISSNTPHLSHQSILNPQVKEYMSSTVISGAPDLTIREAAQLMKLHSVSSLLIIEKTKLVGIVTDRDLRTRVLAEGVADKELVERIMTADPTCVDVNSHLHEAQLKMMADGIHHLPVTQGSTPVGLLTITDILRANNIEPLSIIGSIKTARSVAMLCEIASKVPELVAKLIERDSRAVEVGEIITSLTDGITRRLLILAEEKYGPAPCEYTWLAFGSQARMEQVLGSDQDNGLLLADCVVDENMNYFHSIAEFVNDGLDKCGSPRCPGNIMASNKQWCRPLREWKNCFASWIDQPSPRALMHASIFFDLRKIKGSAALLRELQSDILVRAKKNTIFLALMSENALAHSPPLGFFKTFVLESGGDHNKSLDLKRRGTIPIVDIARTYALSVGSTPSNTLERLRTIEQMGVMSSDLAQSLIDAHEFIAGIRLQAQGKKFRNNEPIDNYLDPRGLSPLVRHQLKEAFQLVRDAQAAMKTRFGGGVL